ncbi:hypothetical protein ACFSCX_23845 [Bacillus salitolerans]|uniref:DUF998 domain-containing protein n=1 Tax=Bacillus salitolerans TaxID=1437434 RepID=A0ABW4LWF5_9BACI
MRTIALWLCIIGGLLWGLKPLYDVLVLDRRINTGYLASDVTDYIKFLFPLFCLGGVFVLFSLYKKKVRASISILAVAVLFHGLFHFSEMYFPNSDIPFGLLFMFSGLVLLLIGAAFLVVQLRREKDIPRLLFRLAVVLFSITFLFCLLPFVSGVFTAELLTGLMVGFMLGIGITWSAIGIALLIIVKSDPSNLTTSI